MTNNKKKSERSTERKAKIEAKVVATSSSSSSSSNKSGTDTIIMPQVKPGVLTNGQLTSLIFLSIGLSRLMQLRSTFPISTSSSASASNDTQQENFDNDLIASSFLEPSPVCIDYLGSTEVCSDPTIHTLMQYKYQSAIQTIAVVGAVLIQVWNTEHLVRKLLTVFTIAPIALGLITLYICHDPIHKVLPFSAFMEQLLMGVVLIILSFWGWYLLITDPGKRATDTYKSIPNICLTVLLFTWIYDGMKLFYDESELHSDDSVLQLFHSSEGSYNFWFAAKPFVYFIAIDKICAALLTLFVWYYLPDPRQRNFLFCVCAIKLIEVFYQLPAFEKDILNYATLRITSIIIAVICGVAWLAPTEIRWINNNNDTKKDEDITARSTEDVARTNTIVKTTTRQMKKVKAT